MRSTQSSALFSALFVTLLAALLLISLPARRANAAPAFTDCEGDACSQITVTFDEARQQFHVQNNSTDHWARVYASNLASYSSACVGPGKEGYLTLKSIVGTYRADYSEARCGEQGAGN